MKDNKFPSLEINVLPPPSYPRKPPKPVEPSPTIKSGWVVIAPTDEDSFLGKEKRTLLDVINLCSEKGYPLDKVIFITDGEFKILTLYYQSPEIIEQPSTEAIERYNKALLLYKEKWEIYKKAVDQYEKDKAKYDALLLKVKKVIDRESENSNGSP